MISNYRSLAIETLEIGTLAFIASAINSKHLPVKIVWITTLLGLCFAIVYFCVLSIIDYLSYDTITSVYTINERESQFPTISFCSQIDRNFQIKILTFAFNKNEYSQDWQNHLSYYRDFRFGTCYRFNSGYNWTNQSIPIKNLKYSGFYDGFRFELYSNTTQDYGQLIVYIHNHTETPVTLDNKGFFISSGSYNYFRFNRLYDQKLEIPYNDCYKNVSESMFNKTIINTLKKQANRGYTQDSCIPLCRSLLYNELTQCNCTLPNVDTDVAFCLFSPFNTEDQRKCVRTFLDSFDVQICFDNYCPLECDQFTYDVTLNSQAVVANGNISNFNWFNDHPNNYAFLKYENFSKNFYSIYVYTEHLKYTYIYQTPKIEMFGLISGIGGILGLFLGISCISTIEIFEISFKLANAYFISKFGFKKVSKNSLGINQTVMNNNQTQSYNNGNDNGFYSV